MKFKDFKVRRLTFAFLQAISVTVLLLFVSTAAVAQEVLQDSLAHIIQKHKLPLTTRIAVEGMYSLIFPSIIGLQVFLQGAATEL